MSNKSDEEIIKFISKYRNEIVCAFIIGSYIYAKNYGDIDIVIISRNLFMQRKALNYKKVSMKATFLPEKMLKEDLSFDKYGSFIYSRFLNPAKVLYNEEYFYLYQEKSLYRELSYHTKINKENSIINFILNRGIYFNKYLKNLNIIEQKDNKYIRYFFDLIEKNSLKNNKNKNARSTDNIYNYWKTRFCVKGMDYDLNEIVCQSNFIKNNNILEERKNEENNRFVP